MRRSSLALVCAVALMPQLAVASPYARAGVWAQAATQPDPNDPSMKPTSSKAPKSQEQEFPDKPEPPPEVKPEPVPEPTPPPVEEKPKWTRHGFGVRGGISVIPTWAVRGYVQSLTNALCRGDTIPKGNFGAGLTRVDGCNIYVCAE